MKCCQTEFFLSSRRWAIWILKILILLNCDAPRTQQDLQNAALLGRSIQPNKHPHLMNPNQNDRGDQQAEVAQHAERHVLKPGETLQDLTVLYGTDRNSILKANGIENWDHMRPGQVILIPVKNSSQ